MKKILLTKGKYAIIDDEDFKYLNQWKWCYATAGYAVRANYLGNYKRNLVYMHRVINKTPENLITDHINRNKLDNRKKNLRTLNRGKNQWNRGKGKNNTSGCNGVYFDKWSNKWLASIMVERKNKNLGRFENIKNAIIARKKGELLYYKQIKEAWKI